MDNIRNHSHGDREFQEEELRSEAGLCPERSSEQEEEGGGGGGQPLSGALGGARGAGD